MTNHKIVLQREYKTLDDFIRGQNNFYVHFLDDFEEGRTIYRTRSYFKRFQENNPKIEKDITIATVKAWRSKPRERLPYEDLWNAYKIMAKLVFIDDKGAINDGKPYDRLLCR